MMEESFLIGDSIKIKVHWLVAGKATTYSISIPFEHRFEFRLFHLISSSCKYTWWDRGGIAENYSATYMAIPNEVSDSALIILIIWEVNQQMECVCMYDHNYLCVVFLCNTTFIALSATKNV